MGITKVLIIGAKGYSHSSSELRIECFLWSDLRRLHNIRDYDAVIISLPTPVGSSLSGDDFDRIFDFDSLKQMLSSGTTVYILGDPRFQVETSSKDFLSWTGFLFDWDGQPGDTISLSNSYDHRHAREYLGGLKSWAYSLGACALNDEMWGRHYDLDAIKRNGARVEAYRENYCASRYGNALAFSVTFSFVTPRRYGGDEEVAPLPGRIEFLPRTSRTEDEDILTILRDFIGVELGLPEPSWVAGHVAPDQEGVDREIAALSQQISALELQRADLEEKRMRVREPIKLLYDRGESLERAVLEVLSVLGAKVEYPEHPGKEDGWISVEVEGEMLEGVLEVKSTKNDRFGEDGLRQLLEWIQRGIETRGKKYKGIFIGNSGIEKEVESRTNPFGDSFKRTAALQNLAVLRSEDLFGLYCHFKAGLLRPKDFWSSLFETSGIINLGILLGETLTRVDPSER